jgi:hypothetical protein
MRTTIKLDDDLLKEAKRIASETDKTLTQLVEDALREALTRRKGTAARAQVALKTFKGRGLQPGVDLDDSAALLELMSRPDVAP